MEEKRSYLRGFILGSVLSLTVVLVIIGGLKLWNVYQLRTDTEGTEESATEVVSDSKLNSKLNVIAELVDKYYLNDIDDEQLKDSVIKGFVNGLGDDYAAYYTKEEMELMMQSTSGAYCGIGATLGQDTEGSVRVISAFDGSPAEKAGLLGGDIITKIDDKDASGMDVSSIAAMAKGEAGSHVKIQVNRDGELKEFDIVREQIEIPSLEYEMLDNQIGLISLWEFSEVTSEQFDHAYKDLQQQGMQGLIIDLRDNYGGVVDAAIDVAEHFLPEGIVVYTEDKQGRKDEFMASGSNIFNKPLVLLVNGNTASSAEILAGAVKDYEKGTLIGTKTFGKGIVQNVISLGDGTALKMTTSKYFTPKGNNIHGIGIEPDITVEYSEEMKQAETYSKEIDNQLQEGIRFITEQIKQ